MNFLPNIWRFGIWRIVYVFDVEASSSCLFFFDGGSSSFSGVEGSPLSDRRFLCMTDVVGTKVESEMKGVGWLTVDKTASYTEFNYKQSKL